MKCFSLVLIFTLSVGCIIAQIPCDWSCFHDPDRTHKLAEAGLPDAWLEGGPAIVWTSEGQGKGSINFTDVMLCCLGEKGTMPLVRATPDAYLPAGSFIIPESGPGMYRAHPVVCIRKLYIRHDDTLFVYDLLGL